MREFKDATGVLASAAQRRSHELSRKTLGDTGLGEGTALGLGLGCVRWEVPVRYPSRSAIGQLSSSLKSGRGQPRGRALELSVIGSF